MESKHFIGVDVSKATLDIAMVVDGKCCQHHRIKNSIKDIKASLPRFLKGQNASFDTCMFCMEYTGIYNLPLLKWLQEKKAKVWLESAVQISKSTGVIRGKNDKVDSTRIALYAYTNRHQVKVWKAPKPIINKVAALLSQRSRLIKAKKQLLTALKEQKLFLDKDITKALDKHNQKPIVVLDQQITLIEKDIHKILKEDEHISRLFTIMTSIDGVGFITAAYVIVTTNEFLNISDPKKYACYAGVVPFEHSSGTSYKGRTRVSHKANKTAKTLLHMSALAAIQMKGDLQDYYQRKVAEGKNRMCVLNAVRNKIVLRMFACVKQNRVFQKKYSFSLANP
jgi:transposase